MRFRRPANTDCDISEIGFGCGGNAGLMTRGSAAEQERIIGRARDLGVNYFDNAPDYGDGIAETHLGDALRTLKWRPLLTSKVEIRAEDLGDIAAHVVRSTEDSLRRLRVDRLDFLQIHNGPTRAGFKPEGRAYAQLAYEDFVRDGGALEGLAKLLRDGKARFVGFVCRGDDGAYVRQLLDATTFHMLNIPYTLLNPSAGMAKPDGLAGRDFGRAIVEAQKRGVGAAIYAPLAGGLLTDAAIDGAPLHPLARVNDRQSASAQRMLAMAKRFRFLRQELGGTLAQAAVRFILAHSGVTTAIGGFSSAEQMEESAAASDAPPLDDTIMARIADVWRAPP